MTEGLAAQMVYGNGEGQTITHYYERGKKMRKQDKKKKCVKKPKK